MHSGQGIGYHVVRAFHVSDVVCELGQKIEMTLLPWTSLTSFENSGRERLVIGENEKFSSLEKVSKIPYSNVNCQ